MKVYAGNQLLADDVRRADNPFRRFMGLMGRKSLRRGEGLLLVNCPSIHCFFMKIPIDAVYLSGEMRVLGVETLKPWRIGRFYKGTRHVLELSAGCAADLCAGDVLTVQNLKRNAGNRFNAGKK